MGSNIGNLKLDAGFNAVPVTLVQNCSDIFRITGGQYIFNPKNVRNTTKADLDLNYWFLKFS